MSFTIENVDEVIQRTGATYKEAKEALEAAEGDVLEAIIKIEEEKGRTSGEAVKEKGNEIVEKLKELVKKGNVTRILLKREGRTILDLPVTAGAVGAVVFTPATIAAIIVSLATGCRIEIQKQDGEIIDVRDVTEEKMESVMDMAEEFGEDVKEKAAEMKGRLKKKSEESEEKEGTDASESEKKPAE